MEPDQQTQGQQPTSMTGSDWQRQALAAARANAAQQSGVAASGLQAARERAAAQDVPDMLAAVDPVPAQQTAGQQQPVQSSSPQPVSESQPAKPIVSDLSSGDAPPAT